MNQPDTESCIGLGNNRSPLLRSFCNNDALGRFRLLLHISLAGSQFHHTSAMKLRHTTTSGNDKIKLQMTPMIDIVFQLLVFFIMTFKIVSQEGDFSIKMPLEVLDLGQSSDLQVETMRVRLEADGTGRLTRLSLNDRVLPFLEGRDGNIVMRHLQDAILAVIGTDRGPGSIQANAEIELDCDFGLNYVHVIEAITAVSGYVRDDNTVIKLIEKIKFAPPRHPGG